MDICGILLSFLFKNFRNYPLYKSEHMFYYAFECKIRVFDSIKRIRLYYFSQGMKWIMTG